MLSKITLMTNYCLTVEGGRESAQLTTVILARERRGAEKISILEFPGTPNKCTRTGEGILLAMLISLCQIIIPASIND